jgi:hypothetical protein
VDGLYCRCTAVWSLIGAGHVHFQHNCFLKAGSWNRILVKFTSSQHGMVVYEKVNFHIREAKHLEGGLGLPWRSTTDNMGFPTLRGPISKCNF